MTVLGAVWQPRFPPENLLGMAKEADAAGLEELWLWEDCFWSGALATMGAVLGSTERLRVGVGVLPVPLRNVAMTAMELQGLYRLFPGRPIIGVGHGAQSWMDQAGARVASPMTLMREYLTALRALLDGERVTSSGRYVNLTDVQLVYPPAVRPPLLMAAIGPKSLRLSGELADGTVLTSETSLERVRAARALIDEGRAEAGRTDPHKLVVYVRAGYGPGAAERVAADAAAVKSDVGVAGDAATIAARVREFAAAGADTVVLQPTADDPDPGAFVRFVSEQVRPLLA